MKPLPHIPPGCSTQIQIPRPLPRPTGRPTGGSPRIRIPAGTLDHCELQSETPFSESRGMRQRGQEGSSQLCQDTACICEPPHLALESPTSCRLGPFLTLGPCPHVVERANGPIPAAGSLSGLCLRRTSCAGLAGLFGFWLGPKGWLSLPEPTEQLWARAASLPAASG